MRPTRISGIHINRIYFIQNLKLSHFDYVDYIIKT